MSNKPTCFVSYCQEDICPERMEIIIKWLSRLCECKIDFLFDGDVKFSDTFDEFEKSIYNVDSILILFSPNYKNRCLDEGNTGVSREYCKILYIMENNKKLQQKEYNKYIKQRKPIYTVLYKGRPETSITKEFFSHHYIDLSSVSKFCENRNQGLTLTDNFINLFKKNFQDMLNEIVVTCIEKTDEYISDYENMLKNLFIDTKSEQINLPDELFIKTIAYNRIIKQQKYLIVGRKGSGKTTVKNTVSSITGNKYKGIISILADQFSADETYRLLFLNKKVRSDIENNFSELDSYKIIWNSFITLYCIFVVYKEYLTNGFSKSQQLQHITSLEKTIVDIFKNKDRIIELSDEEVTKTIYFYVITNLERYIEDIVNKSRNRMQFYRTDIRSSYNVEMFLQFLIGDVAYHDFYYILSFCNKKIFITLDGFDTKFELFKNTTVILNDEEEKKRRLDFENLWLMMFMETLIDLKSSSKLKNIIDLCLTMPVDRIESIKRNNRDFYKYHANTIALSWNCRDLVKLITFRLKYLNAIDIRENDLCDDNELNKIMQEFYPTIPTSIQMERNGYINLPLFLYILRKSFWRPRDIIRYYGCILTLGQNQKNIDNISIKRAIKDESLRIIQDEFFGEFSNIYPNLKEVVNLFNLKKQTLSYDELYEIMKNAPIVINGSIFEHDFNKKINILYTIGFLGINPTKSLIDSQYLYDEYAFVFTEGTSLLRVLKSDLKYQCKFVIHPIFSEYLFLQIDYNNLICNYTWEYVNKIDCNNVDYIIYED